MRRSAVALLLSVLACTSPSEDTRFLERSPKSSPEEFFGRRQWIATPSERSALLYDLSGESFEVYVPTPSRAAPSGALVWVSASRSGAPPSDWVRVLDRHGVIWAGANSSGNERATADRINLALDAAHNVTRLYRVDASTVYVGGFSGGARIASEAALLYPDAFAGGLFIAAADYFRWLRSSDSRWSTWEPTFPPPSHALLDTAKSARWFIFVTGPGDFNRALVRDVHSAYVADRFEHAKLLEVPGLSHELPSAEWFDRMLADLPL